MGSFSCPPTDRERFKALRKSKAAQGDVARVAGVNPTTIHNWESGFATPQVDKLAAVMEVLDAPIEYVVRIPRDQRYPGDWRVLLGVTQPRLASMAGIATTTLKMIELGEVTLTEEKAMVLSRLVHASPEEYTAAWQRARTRPLGEPV